MGEGLYSDHALTKKAKQYKSGKKDLVDSPTSISHRSKNKSYLKEVLHSCDESDELSYAENNSDSDDYNISMRSFGNRSVRSSYETLKYKI